MSVISSKQVDANTVELAIKEDDDLITTAGMSWMRIMKRREFFSRDHARILISVSPDAATMGVRGDV